MASRLDWISGSGISNIDSVFARRMAANAASKSPLPETSTICTCIPRPAASARICLTSGAAASLVGLMNTATLRNRGAASLRSCSSLQNVFVGEVARAGDVAPRLYVASDDPKVDRITHADHHDWYRLRRLHESASGRHGLDENQVGTLGDEFTRHGRQARVVAARRSRLQQHDVPTLGPPELFQLRPQLTEESLDVGAGEPGEKTDAAHRDLALGMLVEVQREQGSAADSHEIAPVHHWITSSRGNPAILRLQGN